VEFGAAHLAIAAVACIASVAALSLLFAAAGARFFRALRVGADGDLLLHVCGSYFLGLALFLALASVVLRFVPTVLGLPIVVVVMMTVAAPERHRLVGGWERLRQAAWGRWAGIGGLILVAVWIPWLRPDDVHTGIIESVGTLHSTRYATLAQSIAAGHLPLVNQNYGQALLAAAVYGGDLFGPHLTLLVWLGVSMVALAGLVHGAIGWLGITGWPRGVALLITMTGNMALSVSHILALGSGWPLLRNGYTDSVCNVATWLLVAMCLANCVAGQTMSRLGLVTLALLTLAWNASGAENILVLGGTAAAVALWAPQGRRAQLRRVAPVFIVCALALVFARLQGGLLCGLVGANPSDLASIPGLQEVGSLHQLRFAPGLEHMFMTADTIMRGRNFGLEVVEGNLDERAHLAWTIAATEHYLWDTPRLLAVPLLGLWGLLRLPLRARRLGTVGVAAMSMSLVGAWPFSIGYYKWELTRFLPPGVIIGFIGIAALLHGIAHWPPRRRALATILLVALSSAAPLSTHAVSCFKSLSDPRLAVQVRRIVGDHRPLPH
jgi:hypothetical protein